MGFRFRFSKSRLRISSHEWYKLDELVQAMNDERLTSKKMNDLLLNIEAMSDTKGTVLNTSWTDAGGEHKQAITLDGKSKAAQSGREMALHSLDQSRAEMLCAAGEIAKWYNRNVGKAASERVPFLLRIKELWLNACDTIKMIGEMSSNIPDDSEFLETALLTGMELPWEDTNFQPAIEKPAEKKQLPKRSEYGGTKHGAIGKKVSTRLSMFKVSVTYVRYSEGYSLDSYYFKLSNENSVKDVLSREGDLALTLGVPTVIVHASEDEAGIVIVDVPRKTPKTLKLKDIPVREKGEIIIGMTNDGKPKYGRISQLPHMLVAGTSGSGKSVFLQSVVAYLMKVNTSREIKFVLIDPKLVTFSAFRNGSTYLERPLVTDTDLCAPTLDAMVSEYESRNRVFSESGVRDLDEYNALMSDSPAMQYPRIVIIADEVSDLLDSCTSRKEKEEVFTKLRRIAQSGRSAGVHLILATQSPNATILPTSLRNNLPTRAILKVADDRASKVALDSTGAENLLGKGDMLYKDATMGVPVRLQTPFISQDEFTNLVQKAK